MSNVACPTEGCPGTNITKVSDNFYVCETRRVTGHTLEPDFNLPLGPPNAYAMTSVPEYGVCGTRIVVGLADTSPGQTATCRCGLPGVAPCQDCFRTLCGLHGGLYVEKWRCGECGRRALLDENRRAIAERRAQERQQEEERLAVLRARPVLQGAELGRWLQGGIPPEAGRAPDEMHSSDVASLFASTGVRVEELGRYGPFGGWRREVLFGWLVYTSPTGISPREGDWQQEVYLRPDGTEYVFETKVPNPDRWHFYDTTRDSVRHPTGRLYDFHEMDRIRDIHSGTAWSERWVGKRRLPNGASKRQIALNYEYNYGR